MKMTLGMGMAIGGPLMKPHRIRKRSLKQIVVARGKSPKNIREQIAFAIGQLIHRGKVSPAQQQNFKRPDRPVRNQRHKSLVLTNEAFTALQFQRNIIAEQARMLFRVIGRQRSHFPLRKIWQRSIRPNLTMGSGLLAPIMAPRFSKICTCWTQSRAASEENCSVQTSTTSRNSTSDMRGIVRSWRGEKHTTRHNPASVSATRNPASFSAICGALGSSAA